MSQTIEELKPALARLPAGKRAALAHFLIHTLDEAQDAETEWDAELARRVKDIKSGKAVGRPADEVFEEIRKKYA